MANKSNKPRQSARGSVTSQTRGDLTAKRKAEEAKKHAEEQAEAAQRMATATAAKQQEDDGTITDFTGEGVSPEELEAAGATLVKTVDPAAKPEPEPDPEPVDARIPAAVEKTAVVEKADVAEVNPATEIVRPREDCTFFFGAGNRYSFSAGRAFKVPREVAQHMREKGLIWD